MCADLARLTIDDRSRNPIQVFSLDSVRSLAISTVGAVIAVNRFRHILTGLFHAFRKHILVKISTVIEK